MTFMARRDILTILLTTFVSMALLYAPQPLYPALAERFGVSQTTVASLVTWSLLPMAVVPLFVGLIMQVVAPRRVLAGSAFLLGITELVFVATDVFWGVVALRFLQGALVSMLLAATMTYVSLQATRVSRVMASYVAASVLGGLLGRLAAGYGAEWMGLSAVFVGIGGLALVSAGLAWTLAPEPTTPRRRIDLTHLADVLRTSSLALLYGVVFSAFFVFTALLNYVPFRVRDLGVEGAGTAGLAYVGFLFGIAASLMAHRVVEVVGGALRAVAVGGGVLAGALGLAWIDAFWGVLGAVVAAAAGFFLLHAVLSGYVNRHTGEEASSVNGLYVAIYYAGGTAGSYVPGLLYEAAGWTAFLGGLALVSAFGMTLLWQATRIGVSSLNRAEPPTGSASRSIPQ